MLHRRTVVLVLAVLVGVATPAVATPRVAAPGWPTATEAVAALGPGVNLGNGYEAEVPGTWGVVVDEALLDAVVAGGFETVRFPVRFDAHALDVAPYTIDPAFLAEVTALVDAATARGLTVIVDEHHYDELHADPVGHRERFLALWEQIATHLADRPPSVWFELLNEPHGVLESTGAWNDLAADALEVVRATNPQRIVVVSGDRYYGNAWGLDTLEVPSPDDDPYVVATFHTYDPFRFTHQGAAWVPGSDAWLGERWSGTQDEIDFLHRVLDHADLFTYRTGVPVLLGEYGAYEAADHGDRVRWTDAVGCVADAHGVPTIYWELAAGFGVWDVPTQTWDEPLLEAVLPPRERGCERTPIQIGPDTTVVSTTVPATDPEPAPPVVATPTFTG